MSNPLRYEKVTATTEAEAYASGDTFGEKMTFTGALREAAQHGGILSTITITGLNTSTFALDILFFDDDFLAGTDNDPFSTSDADWQDKLLGYVNIPSSSWITTANHAVATVNAIAMILQTKANGNLYAQMIARGAVTPGATDAYTVKFGVLKGK